MPATIVLVACMSRKAASAQTPRRLYTSPWFRDAARCAEALSDRWYVVSAAHGLLDPDGPLVEPYDWVCLACGQTGVGRRQGRCSACGSRRMHRSTLAAFSAAERRAWGERVAGQLAPLLRPRDVVVLLAGKRYRDALRPGLRDLGVQVEEPLAHVAGVSVQRRWLQRHTEKFEYTWR